jgi:hypothetical protein
MSCGGRHLGFPTGIKNIKFVEDLPMNCLGMIIGRSSRNFMFFMPIGNPRWPPPQDID